MSEPALSQAFFEKMGDWVLNEIKRAEKPYADPFLLSSLHFCAEKVAPGSYTAELSAHLRRSAYAARAKTCDVMLPDEAIRVLQTAIILLRR